MTPRRRAAQFCDRFGLRLPVLEAPMAGACPPALAVAVAEAGGMGANGVVLDGPERIAEWMREFRAGSDGAVQLNLWIPDAPDDDPARIDAAAAFLGRFGKPAEPAPPAPDFGQQCEAMLAAGPTVVSSIMGLFEPEYVRRLHERGIAWFACATTLPDALAAQEAGADAVVAQGMEAGGHRGTFDPYAAEATDVGLFALLPRLADHLTVPVVAAGGIADGRGVAAALALGASAVQVGTALLRSPEAAIDSDWSAALEGLAPEATTTTRAYSGRLGRAVATPYVTAWQEPGAPRPAPYPTSAASSRSCDAAPRAGVDHVNYWAGQSARWPPGGRPGRSSSGCGARPPRCSREPCATPRRAAACVRLDVVVGGRPAQGHLLQLLEHQLGDRPVAVPLAVRGHDEPRRQLRVALADRVGVDLHVRVPVGPLVDVTGVELPQLLRVVEPREQALLGLGA
jgi:nitronate monooxygenase